MKKLRSYLNFISLFLVIICLIFSLSSCVFVNIDKNSSVELIYLYDDVDVDTQLSKEESKEIIEIFSGKVLLPDNPSCGFDENVSLRINEKIYSPACDDCCIVKDWSSGKYFSISRSQRDTIEEIFSTHGGHFPCI